MIKYNYTRDIYVLLKIKCYTNVTVFFFLYDENTFKSFMKENGLFFKNLAETLGWKALAHHLSERLGFMDDY